MNGIPPVERKRLQNINFVMEDLHGSLNDVYELLVDRRLNLRSSFPWGLLGPYNFL